MGTRYVVALVLVACGSKEPSAPPVPPPDDHQLHREVTPDRALITGKAVSLATLPMMDWLGLPMTGEIDVAINMTGTQDLAHANGTIRIECPANCRLGDDKTKLKPQLKSARNAAFMGDGIRFGHIDFDSVTIAIDVVDGKASISTWRVESKDVKLDIKGTAKLGKTLAASTTDLCVRFASTAALTARDPSMDALIQTTGAVLAEGGMFNIHVEGPLLDAKRRAQICDGSAPAAPPFVPTINAGSAAPPSTLDDATVAKLIASAVTQVGDTDYEIDPSIWEQLLADPTAMTRGARVVPSVKNGTATGFKLYAIKPESVFAKLGLLNGDVIKTVNGFALTSPDLALEAYTKAREAKYIELELDRRGKPMKLNYQIR